PIIHDPTPSLSRTILRHHTGFTYNVYATTSLPVLSGLLISRALLAHADTHYEVSFQQRDRIMVTPRLRHSRGARNRPPRLSPSLHCLPLESRLLLTVLPPTSIVGDVLIFYQT